MCDTGGQRASGFEGPVSVGAVFWGVTLCGVDGRQGGGVRVAWAVGYAPLGVLRVGVCCYVAWRCVGVFCARFRVKRVVNAWTVGGGNLCDAACGFGARCLPDAEVREVLVTTWLGCVPCRWGDRRRGHLGWYGMCLWYFMGCTQKAWHRNATIWRSDERRCRNLCTVQYCLRRFPATLILDQ